MDRLKATILFLFIAVSVFSQNRLNISYQLQKADTAGYWVISDSLGMQRYVFATLSHLNDIPDEPTGTDSLYVLVWADSTDLFSWELQSAFGDHDWYEVGTTRPPDAITDSIYTSGWVGIGTQAVAFGTRLTVDQTSGDFVRLQTSTGGSVLQEFANSSETWRIGNSFVAAGQFTISESGGAIPFRIDEDADNNAFHVKNGEILLGQYPETRNDVSGVASPLPTNNNFPSNFLFTDDATGQMLLAPVGTYPYRTISAPASDTIGITDMVVASVVTTKALPPLAGHMGKSYIVKNTLGTDFTLTTNGGETIDGASSLVIPPGEAYMVHATGSEWKSILNLGSSNGIIGDSSLVKGVGEANKISWWVTSDSLTYSSLLHWTGTSMGIGTDAPTETVDVGTGNVRIRSFSSPNFITADAGGVLQSGVWSDIPVGSTDWTLEGSDHEIFYNDNGALGHDPNYLWNDNAGRIEITGANGTVQIGELGDKIVYNTTTGEAFFVIGNADDLVFNEGSNEFLRLSGGGDKGITLTTHGATSDAEITLESTGSGDDSWRIQRIGGDHRFAIQYSAAQPFGALSEYLNLDISGSLTLAAYDATKTGTFESFLLTETGGKVIQTDAAGAADIIETFIEAVNLDWNLVNQRILYGGPTGDPTQTASLIWNGAGVRIKDLSATFPLALQIEQSATTQTAMTLGTISGAGSLRIYNSSEVIVTDFNGGAASFIKAIDETKRLGIGTTVPDYKLDVRTTTINDIAQFKNTSTGAARVRIGNNTRTWSLGTATSGNHFVIHDVTPAVSAFRIAQGQTIADAFLLNTDGSVTLSAYTGGITGTFSRFLADTGGGKVIELTVAQASAQIDHDLTINYVANQHVDHSAVVLTAGAGMTGGGDITASRTFDVVAGSNTGITVNANDLKLDIDNLVTETTIADADFLAFWDVTPTADNKKITFADLKTAIGIIGLTSAYASMTDGTTTATAVGADVFKYRTANNILSIAVTNNDVTHGDNVLFTINQGNILATAISWSGWANNNEIMVYNSTSGRPVGNANFKWVPSNSRMEIVGTNGTLFVGEGGNQIKYGSTGGAAFRFGTNANESIEFIEGAFAYITFVSASTGDGKYIVVRTDQGSKGAYYYVGNTADGNDSWRWGRQHGGRFDLDYSASQPFATATQYLSILNDGKTGIGTNSPTDRLDVNGTARVRTNGSGNVDGLWGKTSTGVLRHVTVSTGLSLSPAGVLTATGGATTFLGLTDTPSSYSGNDHKVLFVNGSTVDFSTVYFNDANSRVGINQSSPSVDLHVTKSTTGIIALFESTGAVSDAYTRIGNDSNSWDIGISTGEEFQLISNTGSTTPFKIHRSALSNSIYIDSNANLGFGNASPSDRVHMNSASDARYRAQTTGGSNDAGLYIDLPSVDWQVAGLSTDNDLYITDETNGVTPVQINDNAKGTLFLGFFNTRLRNTQGAEFSRLDLDASLLRISRGDGTDETSIEFTDKHITYEGQQKIDVNSVLSPTQITADQNNYNPTGLDISRVLRVSTDASRTITGTVAQTNWTILTWLNIGSNDLVFAHNSGSSTAGNRYLLPGSTSLTIGSNESASFIYDQTSGAWRVLNIAK